MESDAIQSEAPTENSPAENPVTAEKPIENVNEEEAPPPVDKPIDSVKEEEAPPPVQPESEKTIQTSNPKLNDRVVAWEGFNKNAELHSDVGYAVAKNDTTQRNMEPSDEELTPNQREALDELRRQDQKTAIEKSINIAKKWKERDESNNFMSRLIKWLYKMCICCAPILPPLRKERPTLQFSPIAYGACGPVACKLGEVQLADEHVFGIFASVEEQIKETYLFFAGGGSMNDLHLKPLSYKLLKGNGFTYYVKVRVNDGPACLHAKIFKPNVGKPELVGNLDLDKYEDDEITN